MIPISCVNCCFNGLQYDVMGTTFGYCTEHRRLLNSPSELTCGRLLRKDLALPSALREANLHGARYSRSSVCLLFGGAVANGEETSSARADMRIMQEDPVAGVVGDYGLLPTKIATLAQLKVMPGARAEVALLSLGRAYVRRCVDNGGRWTSGLHMLWWVKKRVDEEPSVDLQDLRVELPMPIGRQIELAKWALIMLRLTFVSDIGHHAPATERSVSKLSGILDAAALECGSLSASQLLRWVKREGKRRIEAALSERTYERLRAEIRSEAEEAD